MKTMKTLALAAVAVFAAAIGLSGTERNADSGLFDEGGFFVGCNYWSGHAGMYMWRNWNPEYMEKEIAALAENGVEVMRVFPLWPDFQPLTGVYGGYGELKEMRQGDKPLRNDAGVDEEMMRRFRFLCDLAKKHDMKLVVGLITGWMSGRRFCPQPFERRSPIVDSQAVVWEIKFVRHFVRSMKDHPAIAAWDLGNECNVMGGKDATQADAWRWMFEIGEAIRMEDASRPVVSGMHSLTTAARGTWTIRQNGELMDVLTTHPYPYYTPGCSREPFNTMRTELHPTAESLLYSHISGKPCFVEEVGGLGESVESPDRAGANVRVSLFSCWAHDLKGYLWWCNADQEDLHFPPYDWTANERELGLLATDFSPKPVMREMKAFQDFRRSLPFDRLPPRQTDAVVVVSERESGWKQAFGSFLLAKQAGFDVSFAGAEHELPDSRFYMLTSWTTDTSFTHAAWLRLQEKVRGGATLLIVKAGETRLTDWPGTTGIMVDYTHLSPVTRTITLKDEPSRPFTVRDKATCRIVPRGADVLATDDAGDAAMTCAAFGKGRMVVVNAPLDLDAIERGDSFWAKDGKVNPAYLAFRKAAALAGVKRKVVKEDAPALAVTEHPAADGSTIVIAINCNPESVKAKIKVDGTVGTVWRGKVSAEEISLPGNDAAVFEVR